MAVNPGQRYKNTPGETEISWLVGMAVERIALNAMDPKSPYGSDGQTVRDRLNQLAQKNAEMKELNAQFETLLPNLSDQDWISYKEIAGASSGRNRPFDGWSISTARNDFPIAQPELTEFQRHGVYQYMSRLIPFGALVPPVVISAVFLGGCASPEVSRRASVLALPYLQFDQTFGSGWRSLFDSREYSKAAVLVEDYLRSHHDFTVGEQKFLHFHAAQLLALENKNARAVEHLDQAVCHEKTRELGPN